MDAGVDEKPRRAPELPAQIAAASDRIVVIEALFIGQLFGIKTPALSISVEADEAPQQRHVAKLLGQRDLEMVTRNGFVKILRRQVDLGHLREIAQIDEVNSGRGAIERGRAIISARRSRLREHRHAPNLEAGVRQMSKPLRRKL